jgi:hypothetical protein
MKKITTIILLLFFGNMFSQQFSLDNKLTRSFFADETKAPSLDVILVAKIDSDKVNEFTLNYQGNSKIFKLKPLTYSDFEAKLKFNLSELISSTKDKNDTINLVTKTASEIKIPENSIAFLFTQIVSYYNTEEEKPQVATIYLKEGINIYYNKELKKEEKHETIGTLENVSVEISFYGGFIEKIQVNGKINDEEVSFNNKYSIGISSTKNISQLSDNRLYSNEKFSEEFAKKIFPKSNEPQINKLKGRESLFISVGDIIRYVKKVDVNANDISPVPQLIILDEKQKVTKLYKEESSKLFEAIVYTDFFGIFDEESPNGIIQTEVNKRFNINTKRNEINKWYGILFPPLAISEGFGFFQSFDALFQYSKIEKNNKFLLPENFEIKDNNGTVISTENYYSPLSLYQYRSFSIGGNLNLMTLENQNAKLNMYLNVGVLFGRSGIKENENQEVGTFLNNIEIPIEYKFHLLPEKRVSFIFGDRLSWFEVEESAYLCYS